MQPDHPRYKKFPDTHSLNTNIISISNDEALQTEEEINGQKTMPYKIVIDVGKNPFHVMENDHSKCRYSSQPIQN